MVAAAAVHPTTVQFFSVVDARARQRHTKQEARKQFVFLTSHDDHTPPHTQPSVHTTLPRPPAGAVVRAARRLPSLSPRGARGTARRARARPNSFFAARAVRRFHTRHAHTHQKGKEGRWGLHPKGPCLPAPLNPLHMCVCCCLLLLSWLWLLAAHTHTSTRGLFLVSVLMRLLINTRVFVVVFHWS